MATPWEEKDRLDFSKHTTLTYYLCNNYPTGHSKIEDIQSALKESIV